MSVWSGLTVETLDIIEEKKTAKLLDLREWHRLKGVYKAKSKVDLEKLYTSVAEETEAGFHRNDLGPAYHAIKQRRGGQQSGYNDIRSDGTLCTTAEEIATRWEELYQATLNHPLASDSADLDNSLSAATPDTSVLEDAPTLDNLVGAARRLKSGKEAGPHGTALLSSQ